MKKIDLNKSLEDLGQLRNREELLSEDMLRSIIDKKSVQTNLSNVKPKIFRRLIMPLTGAGILVSALMLIFTNQADENVVTTTALGTANSNIITKTTEKSDKSNSDVNTVKLLENNIISDNINSDESPKEKGKDKSEKKEDIKQRRIIEYYEYPNEGKSIEENNGVLKYKGRIVRKLRSVENNGSSNTTTSFAIGSGGKDNTSILLHPSANDKRTGHSIGGIVVLNLNREELEKIGVKLTGNTVEFITERTDRIHPIDYKRLDEYRNSEEVQKYVKAEYPLDGSLFCVKEHIAVEIKDWKIRDKKEEISRKMKDLDYHGYDSRWPEEKRRKAQLANEEMNRLGQIKSAIGLDINLQNYDGQGIDGYSGISPLLYTCTYKDKRDNILNRVFKTPLFFIHNPRHPLFLTNSDPYYKDMVPVEINLNEYFDNHDDYYAERVVLWYYPTDEFLNALPDRYAKKLRKEAEILRQIRSGAMPEEEACKGFNEDESFYDICRISSGPVSIQNIFPNPALNSTSMKFRINNSAKVSINLYRTNGDFVREIRNEQLLSPGEYTININLSGLQPGIYLASVKTNMGEVAVIRFVKQ